MTVDEIKEKKATWPEYATLFSETTKMSREDAMKLWAIPKAQFDDMFDMPSFVREFHMFEVELERKNSCEAPPIIAPVYRTVVEYVNPKTNTLYAGPDKEHIERTLKQAEFIAHQNFTQQKKDGDDSGGKPKKGEQARQHAIGDARSRVQLDAANHLPEFVREYFLDPNYVVFNRPPEYTVTTDMTEVFYKCYAEVLRQRTNMSVPVSESIIRRLKERTINSHVLKPMKTPTEIPSYAYEMVPHPTDKTRQIKQIVRRVIPILQIGFSHVAISSEFLSAPYDELAYLAITAAENKFTRPRRILLSRPVEGIPNVLHDFEIRARRGYTMNFTSKSYLPDEADPTSCVPLNMEAYTNMPCASKIQEFKRALVERTTQADLSGVDVELEAFKSQLRKCCTASQFKTEEEFDKFARHHEDAPLNTEEMIKAAREFWPIFKDCAPYSYPADKIQATKDATAIRAANIDADEHVHKQFVISEEAGMTVNDEKDYTTLAQVALRRLTPKKAAKFKLWLEESQQVRDVLSRKELQRAPLVLRYYAARYTIRVEHMQETQKRHELNEIKEVSKWIRAAIASDAKKEEATRPVDRTGNAAFVAAKKAKGLPSSIATSSNYVPACGKLRSTCEELASGKSYVSKVPVAAASDDNGRGGDKEDLPDIAPSEDEATAKKSKKHHKAKGKKPKEKEESPMVSAEEGDEEEETPNADRDMENLTRLQEGMTIGSHVAARAATLFTNVVDPSHPILASSQAKPTTPKKMAVELDIVRWDDGTNNDDDGEIV
jgi:hypothetical protein